jgi:D-psicose/D-tagatose/L-ribulose 3-epimerase
MMKPVPQAKPNAWRIGCCGSMISPATDRLGVEIVESLAQFGFDYIELSLSDMAALPPPAFRRLRERMARSGIPCEACNNFFPPRVRLTGSNARLPAALEYAESALERAARLGVSIIVFGSSGAKNVPPGFSQDTAWQQIVHLLQHLGPRAAVHGITIAIEPLNQQESNIINRTAEGIKLAQAVNHPNVQLLIDYYHLRMEQENPEVILAAGPTVRHLHFAQVAGRAFPQGEDEGYTRFFDCLRKVDYQGRCSIEAYTQDFAADAPRALQLLRAITANRPARPQPGPPVSPTGKPRKSSD